MARRSGIALVALALALWVSLPAAPPAAGADGVQAVVHYAAPAGYHALVGKHGENGTLYYPYHFIVDYTHHKLYDLPYTLYIGPYEGLPDTYDVGIRFEGEVSTSVYIYPGDNITLVGHFTDAQGQPLEQPYIEVIHGEPFQPGPWPTPTPTVTATASTTNVTTTATPSPDQRLAACIGGGDCTYCPAEVCTARADPGARLYALGSYLGPGGECAFALAFSSADGQATVLIPSDARLSWTDQYRYLEISQAAPRAAADGSTVVGNAYELGPEGMASSAPLQLALAYEPASLPAGAREQDLYLGWWNASASAWDRVGFTLDATGNVLLAGLNHFSTYAVVSPPHAPTTTTATPTASSTPLPAPTSNVPPATPPQMVVITTASFPDAQAPDPAVTTSLRGTAYTLLPPLAVLVLSVAACAVVMRWVR